MNIDLTKIKSIYFIGIKGVAMSGLAVMCRQMGKEVSGSDVSEKFITDAVLHANAITVFEKFSEKNLKPAPDLVVIGGSWDKTNIEVAYTLGQNIPHVAESELRGHLSTLKKTIAVTGVHGKTTTTALIAFALDQLDASPSYLIGTGEIPGLPANAAWQPGEYFVVEGDEYVRYVGDLTPKFLELDPEISIITSIEWEHVDVFKNVAIMEENFARLIEKTKQFVIACGDWPSVKTIISRTAKKVVTYGLSEDNEWRAVNIRYEEQGTVFTVEKGGMIIDDFTIQLAGEHNVLNALAAIIVLASIGMKIGEIKEVITLFSGTQRRFQVFERKGITFVDDYAHHPTEIKMTLKAIAQRFPTKKIWCVFQPHTYTRTRALLGDFAKSFSSCHKLFLTDIFASARETERQVSIQDLVEATKLYHPDVHYIGGVAETAAHIAPLVDSSVVVVTMGAGNVYELKDKLSK